MGVKHMVTPNWSYDLGLKNISEANDLDFWIDSLMYGSSTSTDPSESLIPCKQMGVKF